MIIVTQNKAPVMKSMQDIEHRLMAEFTIETMMGNSIDVKKMPEYSEDSNVQMMQEQYAHWCIASKKLLLADTVDSKSLEGRFASMMKTYMIGYAIDETHNSNQAMKYLYYEDDTGILVQQISMLAKYAHYKDAVDFNSIPEEMRRKSLDPGSVCVSIGLYVLFTILVNTNLAIDQYNELFRQTWFNYYENWMVRELMFQMRGNATKQDFAGVLIS